MDLEISFGCDDDVGVSYGGRSIWYRWGDAPRAGMWCIWRGGRQAKKCVDAVVDDFGTLVEVQP